MKTKALSLQFRLKSTIFEKETQRKLFKKILVNNTTDGVYGIVFFTRVKIETFMTLIW